MDDKEDFTRFKSEGDKLYAIIALCTYCFITRNYITTNMTHAGVIKVCRHFIE